MATTCNLEAFSRAITPGGVVSKITGTIDLADVVVNTTPTATGGWNTATVTADKQSRFYLVTADAATAGMPEGWYERVTAPGTGNLFRRQTH